MRLLRGHRLAAGGAALRAAVFVAVDRPALGRRARRLVLLGDDVVLVRLEGYFRLLVVLRRLDVVVVRVGVVVVARGDGAALRVARDLLRDFVQG